jgi:hypothetical protein
MKYSLGNLLLFQSIKALDKFNPDLILILTSGNKKYFDFFNWVKVSKA